MTPLQEIPTTKLTKMIRVHLYGILFFIMQIVEEAGGTVTCMDGERFCVFDRSVLVSNGVLHAKV